MNRHIPRNVMMVVSVAAAAVTVLLTAAAFWLSYEHLHDVAAANGLGNDDVRSWAWPATVDLFILAGELLLLRSALQNRGVDWWAVALTAVGSLGSIALNVAGVGTGADALEYIVAAVPPAAALIAFGALMRQVHHRLAKAGVSPETDAVPEPSGTPVPKGGYPDPGVSVSLPVLATVGIPGYPAPDVPEYTPVSGVGKVPVPPYPEYTRPAEATPPMPVYPAAEADTAPAFTGAVVSPHKPAQDFPDTRRDLALVPQAVGSAEHSHAHVEVHPKYVPQTEPAAADTGAEVPPVAEVSPTLEVPPTIEDADVPVSQVQGEAEVSEPEPEVSETGPSEEVHLDGDGEEVPVPDPLVPQARQDFATELADGKTPGVRRLRTTYSIGQPRAQAIRNQLTGAA